MFLVGDLWDSGNSWLVLAEGDYSLHEIVDSFRVNPHGEELRVVELGE